MAFEILEGPYKGRKVFVNLNLENPSTEAVKFAMADLRFCLACGVRDTVHDTVALHNLPLQIVVKVKPRKAKAGQPDTGELQNVIVEYRRRDGSKITTGPAAAAQPMVSSDAGAPPGSTKRHGTESAGSDSTRPIGTTWTANARTYRGLRMRVGVVGDLHRAVRASDVFAVLHRRVFGVASQPSQHHR